MSADRPVWLIMRHCVRRNRFQDGESRFGPVRFADCGGVSSLSAERRRNPEQLLVEQHNRGPVSAAAARALSMYGLDGGFELESTGATLFERFAEMTFRFFDQRK